MKYILLLISGILFLGGCQEKIQTTTSLIEANQKASGANLLGNSVQTLSFTENTVYEDNSDFTAYKKYQFPDKLKVEQVYPGFTQDYIINGDEGFSVANQIQGSTITPEKMPSFKEETHLMQFYRWEERGWNYEYTGKEKIGELDYYVLVGQHEGLGLNNKIFLHPSTYLISKIILRSPTYNATAEFFDYFKSNGLQYPAKYTVTSGNIITTTQTKEFVVNPIFPENTFIINIALE